MNHKSPGEHGFSTMGGTSIMVAFAARPHRPLNR
jgi:hypothetical protein